ncbi:MAG TPA: SAM-dependent methyltransferase [Burkholderiaceae bacterium]|nr:SAM-dependent methyltransferase [Burkholderiaceae bacterium]
MGADGNESVSAPLLTRIRAEVVEAGGWLPFDRYMQLALYAPGLGYYARAKRPFGRWPGSGSDFVTAPELSPLFSQALAVQLRQALRAADTDVLLEFGAGSGALAEGLLDALADAVARYQIVEVSAALRETQRQRLHRFGDRVQWLSAVPEGIDAVVIGNEVLDAMPVQLLAFDGQRWHERGVALGPQRELVWRDRASRLRPPVEAAFVSGSVTELHLQAQAFVASLAGWLHRGAAFFIDYGFPAAEYHHPQRTGGTLMCHRAHRADSEPLHDPGEKDITAHVDFTAIALAAQEAGLQVLGYTSQARFLLNCGLLDLMQRASVPQRAAAHMLVAEHEMGELFKVIGLAKGCSFDAIGFATGDRSHRL